MPASNPSARITTLKPAALPSAGGLIAALALLVLANSAAASPPGKWTPPRQWPATAVHLMLVPGDDSPYHSRVLWWQEEDPGPVFLGGLWGWKTGGDGCDAYPNAYFDSLGMGSANVNIFCAGAAPIGSGEKLFVAGGTEPGTENGITAARIFSPGTGSGAGSWTAADTMLEKRWYPTITALSGGGRALVASGSMFSQIYYQFGRKNGALPASPAGDSLYLCNVTAGGGWDTPIKPRVRSGQQKPAAREGHTALDMTGFYSLYLFFGGRNAAGNPLNDLYELRRDALALASGYDYDWNNATPSGTTPAARSEHSAVVVENSNMVIYGGLDGSNQARADVWRVWIDESLPQPAWHWVATTITNPSQGPSARFSHAAVFDRDHGNRMLVFGGVADTNKTPTDSKVWALTFSTTLDSASWSALVVRDSFPKPAARFNHSMQIDDLLARQAPDGVTETTRAVLFGGQLGPSSYSDSL